MQACSAEEADTVARAKCEGLILEKLQRLVKSKQARQKAARDEAVAALDVFQRHSSSEESVLFSIHAAFQTMGPQLIATMFP